MLSMSSISTQALTLTDVGAALREARKSRKLTQTALGKMAGVSRMPIYRVEAGQDISLRTLLSILSALRLALQMEALPDGAPSVKDLKTAFAHLHAEEDE